MSMMGAVEFILTAALGVLFFRKNLHRRFPAMGSYLSLRVISAPVLAGLLYGSMRPWGRALALPYFFAFWAVYVASAVLLFFICIEVFRTALLAFSGLQRLGTIVFRWAALVSLIVSLSTVSLQHFDMSAIPAIAGGLMRSVSVLELCLLAFLCLSMQALRLSARDTAFGLAFGFGLMSTNDFVMAAMMPRMRGLAMPLQFVYEAVILVVLGIWGTYCILPEPVRKLVVLPANSNVYRWNEIASALGHAGTRVAMPQPANGFFLTDVERVVEKVLARNLRSSESGS
jgi:hypothetical protein